MKIAKACSQCRSAKRRCHAQADAACLQCKQRDLACSQLGRASATQHRAVTLASKHLPDRQEVDVLSTDDSRHCVTLYFHFIHDRPHSLFHIRSLWNDFDSDHLSQCLLMALSALGARFSDDPTIRQRIPRMTTTAKNLFKQQLEIVSLERIQTAIILANLCAAELETDAEALYFGIANRMAHMLQLHLQNPLDNHIEKEVKCRVWWTLIMADAWCSAGLGLPQSLPQPNRTLQLPQDEHQFQASSVYSSETQGCRGLWAYMITLVDKFGPIMSTNERLIDGTVTDTSIIDQAVHDLGLFFDDWKKTLPSSYAWSIHNLELHRHRGTSGAFVALHLGYYHYVTLLYFQYLDLDRNSTSLRRQYAAECRRHATAYSDVLAASRKESHYEASHATVGHMTVVSSSVLLHTLLFGNDEDAQNAKQRLGSNFDALLHLRNIWPSLTRAINRLYAFQNACMRSCDPNTHKIDQWMVRFLLEHSMMLSEKEAHQVPHTERNEKSEEIGSESNQDVASLETRHIVSNSMLSTLSRH